MFDLRGEDVKGKKRNNTKLKENNIVMDRLMRLKGNGQAARIRE